MAPAFTPACSVGARTVVSGTNSLAQAPVAVTLPWHVGAEGVDGDRHPIRKADVRQHLGPQRIARVIAASAAAPEPTGWPDRH
jgi:hypothetical protein